MKAQLARASFFLRAGYVFGAFVSIEVDPTPNATNLVMETQLSLVLELERLHTTYSLDDAVDLIHKIHLQLEAIEDYSLIETAFNLVHRYITGAWITMKLEPQT